MMASSQLLWGELVIMNYVITAGNLLVGKVNDVDPSVNWEGPLVFSKSSGALAGTWMKRPQTESRADDILLAVSPWKMYEHYVVSFVLF